jgi:dTDP-4-amino-4,6-dideoxygalactose transaminase
MGIQLFKASFDVEACLGQVRECLEKGWTGMGYKTVEFEEAWKKYTGHKCALFINSNTSGLYMAVDTLKEQYNWADDDEVISTPLTFISTNHAIHKSNLKAVFADVDDTLCLDPKSVEEHITDKTRAVIFVGFGGNTGSFKKIVKICRNHDLKLILDAAHMSGTKVNGVTPGTWDGVDVTVYSYQAVKNLATGDSGMICWNNEADDKLTRQIAWLGINKDTYARSNKGTYAWKYDVDYVGYKYNGNAIMAAIALVQLQYLDEENGRRRQIVEMYNEGFKNNPNIKAVPAPHHDECSYHIYELIVPDREALLGELAKHDIYGGVHYRDNTEYSMYLYANGTCPYAHAVSQKLITLPMHMWLSDEDVQNIIKIVNDFTA